jgi:hypothetical protein
LYRQHTARNISSAHCYKDGAAFEHELANELAGCPSGANYCDVAKYYEIEYGRNRLVQRLRDRFDALMEIRINRNLSHSAYKLIEGFEASIALGDENRKFSPSSLRSASGSQ